MSCLYDVLKARADGRVQNDRIHDTNAPEAVGGIICRDENGTKYWYHYL